MRGLEVEPFALPPFKKAATVVYVGRYILDTPVLQVFWDASTRTKNVLKVVDCLWKNDHGRPLLVRDLAVMTPAELRKWKNCGKTTVADIQGRLGSHHMSLGMVKLENV